MKYYKITSRAMFEDCLKTLEAQGYLCASGATPTTHFEYFPSRSGYHGYHIYIRVRPDKTISYGSDLPEGVFDFELPLWELQNTKRPSIFKGNK